MDVIYGSFLDKIEWSREDKSIYKSYKDLTEKYVCLGLPLNQIIEKASHATHLKAHRPE